MDRSTAMADDNNARRSFVHRAAPVVCCMINTLILLFIVISFGGLIAWLILHPQVPNFRIKLLNISNFSALSNETLPSLNYQIEFSVENPNSKINLLFYNLDVCITYRNMFVMSKTEVHELHVWRSGRINKTVTMGTDVDRARVKSRIIAADLARKRVTYEARMKGVAMFSDGKWIRRQKIVKVVCKNLTVVFKRRGNGTMIGNGHDCHSFFT